MRAIILGLALLGLPAVTSADSLAAPALLAKDAGTPAPLEYAQPSRFGETTRARPAVHRPEPAGAPSAHREDEQGAVILELRSDGHGQSRQRPRPVHCHGHWFSAIETAPNIERR